MLYINLNIPRNHAGCLLICLTLMGCGTGSYEENMQASLLHYQNETPFKDMLPQPAALANGLLSIRLPKMFAQENTYALDEKTSDPRRPDTPLDANRVQPDFLTLPGHLRTYEHFAQIQDPADATLGPVYVYVAMIPRRSKTADQLKKQLRATLVTRFGELPPDEEAAKTAATRRRPGQNAQLVKGVGPWKPHTTANLDGGTVAWQKIIAQGPQTIQNYDKENNVKKLILPGRYILYLRSTEDYHIMIAWRALWQADEEVQMEKLADTCVGTVRVGEAE
ncbi:MAG: hypothetical protein OES79_00750 [Planctomycetota bacterium]|nr:hypothetical protein [Planctomycetota bacterium]